MDKIIQSYKRWLVQTAREFNIKDDDVENVIKSYYSQATK